MSEFRPLRGFVVEPDPSPDNPYYDEWIRLQTTPLRQQEWLETVWYKTQGRCWYCGGPSSVTDHQIPQVQGGQHFFSNLVPACRFCNTSKKGSSVEEYRGRVSRKTGQLFVLFWAERRELAAVFSAKTPRIPLPRISR